MTLSEVIVMYRNEHGISQRQFGAKCNLSTGYISLIEKGVNPQTGKPTIPSLTVLNKIAKGMGKTVDELIASCDDMLVTMSDVKTYQVEVSPALSENEQALLDGFRKLNEQGQEKALEYIELLLMKGENLAGDYSVQVG